MPFKPMPDGMEPVAPREVEGGSSSSNSISTISTTYKEVARTWNAIPSEKPNCTDYTVTRYDQVWPYNSYVDERKEANQAIMAQLVPPSSIIENCFNEKFVQAGASAFDPVTATTVKTIYNFGKLWGWWGKNKDDSNDPYNGRVPAGCASIAFLQLLYYYKDIKSIKQKYPELQRLKTSYNWKNVSDKEVDDMYSIMSKIAKAIPLSFYSNWGTGVLFPFMSEAGKNLGFKEFIQPVYKPTNKKAAELIYQSLCNGILPIVLGTNGGGHYFLIDGCKFDKTVFNRTNDYNQACTFSYNDGWGDGSTGYVINDHESLSTILNDVLKQDHVDGIWFFAPAQKRVKCSRIIV